MLHETGFYWQGQLLNISLDEEQPCWVAMVTTPSMVMVARVFDKEPDAAALWDMLLEALQIPQVGDFLPPTVLKVKPNQAWEQLAPQLREVGIALEICADLEIVDGDIETIDRAFLEWDRHRIKWKILRRDDDGTITTVESGLSRADAELSLAINNGGDDKQTHWMERDGANDPTM
jgi:hypothetical protein